MVCGILNAPHQVTRLMQRHHSLNRYNRHVVKCLVLTLALCTALAGLLIPSPVAARDVTREVERDTLSPTMTDVAAAAAANATNSYLSMFAASTATGADVALENASASLDVVPPLPSRAPTIAPAVSDEDPNDNLIEVGPIDLGPVNNVDSGDAAAGDAAEAGTFTEAGDVDTRSTAFDPRDLSMLSEIDMPDEAGRWIRVDLSEQMVIAYVGNSPIRGFIVSTGLPDTPTVTGTFRIRMKVRSQTMTGGDPALGTYYNLSNVEWVQYFYADYGFHGTYWHNNFGQPMSHGCINMTNADAKWLFDWAGPKWDGETVWYPSHQENPGTLVIVHE